MKRRLFLKGVAGASLAVPFLPSLHRKARAAAPAAAPRRLVIFYTNNGCLTNRWFPKVENGALTADALMGTTLEGLAPLAPKLLFPRGLAMFPRGMINGYFDPHDQGMGSKLTCAPIDPDMTVNTHYATARSLDHVAAEMVNPRTKTPLVLSVGFASTNVKQIVSYSAPNTPYAPEVNVRNVYNSLTGLFGGGTTTPADYRVLQGRSVMDLVKGELDTWKAQDMSTADRQRVDAWQSLLRQTETTVVSASCNAENAAALGIDAQKVQMIGRDTAAAFQTGGDMMINLIALTMMCDANRVIIMQWPGFAKFTWLTYNGAAHQYDHHGLSHRNGSAAVGGTCVTGVIDMIGQIDNWYAGRYTKLVNLLNGITEGDRKMLDNSAVMWLPELADGNAHNNNNLPIVIAGSAGGYLKQGVSVNLDPAGATLGTGNSEAACGTSNTFGNSSSRGGNVPLNKLYTTLLNAIGQGVPNFKPVTSFGTVDSNDLTKGITNPGELTAIKA